MLLDLAGIDRNERTMIQASIGNARDFDKIADALIVQHPRIHMKALKTAKPQGGKPSRKGNSSSRKGQGKGKGGKSRWRNPSGFAFHAAEEDFACGYTAAEDGSEPLADPAFVDDEDYSDGDAEA